MQDNESLINENIIVETSIFEIIKKYLLNNDNKFDENSSVD